MSGPNGNNSVTGALVVLGGEGGILINNTGPRAHSGGGNHSAQGGRGYGAGGGSGGIKWIPKDISRTFGGNGADGVVYVEMVSAG